MIKIIQRQAPTYLKMGKPMLTWGLPAALGAVWFTWPAGSGKFLFGVGAKPEEEE